jgi:hypothetical protein
MIDDLKTFTSFACGAAAVALLVRQPAYFELGLLVTGLTAFWAPMSRLALEVGFDRDERRLELALRKTWHVDCDALTAFRLLVEVRKPRQGKPCTQVQPVLEWAVR